jgi:hypothetical protein
MSLHPDQLQARADAAEAAFEATHPGALARYRDIERQHRRRERFDRWFAAFLGGTILLGSLLSCQPAAATSPALRHVTGPYWAFTDGYLAHCYYHESRPTILNCVQHR